MYTCRDIGDLYEIGVALAKIVQKQGKDVDFIGRSLIMHAIWGDVTVCVCRC